VPAGDRTWLRPVDVQLACRPCPGATPAPPGQLPGNRRSAHAHVDVVRALNHPGPADGVWLHPHQDVSRACRARRDRVGAHAGRTARSQPTRQNGGCDDTQDPGCAAQLKIHSPVPQGHALARRRARAGRPAQRSPDAAAAGPGTNGPVDRDLLQAISRFISEPGTIRDAGQPEVEALCERISRSDLIGAPAVRLQLAIEVAIPTMCTDLVEREFQLGLQWSTALHDEMAWAAFATYGTQQILALSPKVRAAVARRVGGQVEGMGRAGAGVRRTARQRGRRAKRPWRTVVVDG
jgi:hypothetical protein